jgi:hypothetical protein
LLIYVALKAWKSIVSESVSAAIPAAPRSRRIISAVFSGKGRTGRPGARVVRKGLSRTASVSGTGCSAVRPFLVKAALQTITGGRWPSRNDSGVRLAISAARNPVARAI